MHWMDAAQEHMEALDDAEERLRRNNIKLFWISKGIDIVVTGIVAGHVVTFWVAYYMGLFK